MIAIKTIEDVVNYQLCSGCGVCAAAEADRYEMKDLEQFGVRPHLKEKPADSTGEGFKLCPGAQLEHHYDRNDKGLISELEDCWGPVYGVWEGYAADEDIRYKGSSGGAASALALFGLEKKGSKNVIQVGSQKEAPYLNQALLSESKEDLLKNAGSRYAPASPCEALNELSDESTAVFIGKPCDVAAVSNWQNAKDTNREKIEIKIGFFCAGTPSTSGNKALLKREGVSDVESLESLKYRGEGWPGQWKALFNKGESKSSVSLTYAESWGFLQSFRQWRCYICPDHTAEFADIAVGDPWYREVKEGEAGKSLIVARTRKGLEYLKAAQSENYIVLEQERADLLPLSQPNLIKSRGDLWGRINTLRLMGAPVPRYEGFKLFKFWLADLDLKAKIASFTGTAKRVGRKKLKVDQKIL